MLRQISRCSFDTYRENERERERERVLRVRGLLWILWAIKNPWIPSKSSDYPILTGSTFEISRGPLISLSAWTPPSTLISTKLSLFLSLSKRSLQLKSQFRILWIIQNSQIPQNFRYFSASFDFLTLKLMFISRNTEKFDRSIVRSNKHVSRCLVIVTLS